MRPPPTLFEGDDVQAAVARMAGEISADHPDGFVAIAVLKGSVLLLADLVRHLSVPVEVDFIAISHFAPDSGRVRIVKDVEIDIEGRDVVLVEDIVDTGLTLTYLVRHLQEQAPARVRVATMLDRLRRRIVPVDIDYRGFDLDDEFVLGYGLDFAERYRNLRQIVAGDVRGLQDDPDLHVESLYGS